VSSLSYIRYPPAIVVAEATPSFPQADLDGWLLSSEEARILSAEQGLDF
jgi:hypothetical protein